MVPIRIGRESFSFIYHSSFNADAGLSAVSTEHQSVAIVVSGLVLVKKKTSFTPLFASVCNFSTLMCCIVIKYRVTLRTTEYAKCKDEKICTSSVLQNIYTLFMIVFKNKATLCALTIFFLNIVYKWWYLWYICINELWQRLCNCSISIVQLWCYVSGSAVFVLLLPGIVPGQLHMQQYWDVGDIITLSLSVCLLQTL